MKLLLTFLISAGLALLPLGQSVVRIPGPGGSPSAGGPVTFDAAATTGVSGGYLTSPVTFTLTMGSSGGNRAVAVGAGIDGGSLPSGFAITVGGVNANAVSGAQGGTYNVTTLYCAAMGSATGAQTVSISWTSGYAYVFAGAISATNVDQSTPCINGGVSGSAAPTSLTITSSSGDLTTTTADTTAAGLSTNQTQKWSSTDSNYWTFGDVGPGTGTTTHTWTGSGTTTYVVGADFKKHP